MISRFWATTTMETSYTAEPESYESPTSPTESNQASSPTTGRPPAKRRMSAHAQADAARAMQHTSNWAPLERRQSWSKEDQKHALHMSACCIDSVKTGPGFSERSST